MGGDSAVILLIDHLFVRGWILVHRAELRFAGTLGDRRFFLGLRQTHRVRIALAGIGDYAAHQAVECVDQQLNMLVELLVCEVASLFGDDFLVQVMHEHVLHITGVSEPVGPAAKRLRSAIVA